MARPRRGEGGGAGRVFTSLLAVVLIAGLGAVVVYLLSEINSHRYRLHTVGNELVIEKGRFLPAGFQRYVPGAKTLADAYAPLLLPDSESLGEPEIYDDRADLDRALFALLAGWARKGLDSEDPDALFKATRYIERCELLPGLSEQQRAELKTLRADLAYKHGRQLLSRIDAMLQEALAELKLSITLGTSRPTDADRWIIEVEKRIAARGYRFDSPLPMLQDAPSADAPAAAPSDERPKLDVEAIPREGSGGRAGATN